MAFQSFADIGEVATAYQIVLNQEAFISASPVPVNEYFREELAFVQNEMVIRNSEGAVTEHLIGPVLKEAWKPYRSALVLWNHEPLRYDDTLQGVPDYFVAKRSRLGIWVREQPYLLVVEAKRDDFIKGWAQCLAAMVAAQRLNTNPNQTIFGIVTNGKSWEFGKLLASEYTQHPGLFLLSELELLVGAIRQVLDECKQQVLALVA